ncbi:type VI secretion system contractile sheath domain-containing protein [Marivita hallyeonensis]|uniref:type VI secretion system contractile sheath domain-containing protein n=1 Tax=Marivita hallyeonensis TaxID=996342 RepID=UPI0015B5D825|nr:type VI secretion system contractile sheath large subunit [Marivita hallyeonensis]
MSEHSDLKELLDLRQSLRTPTTFDHAARTVRELLSSALQNAPDAGGTDESDSETMNRLFGTPTQGMPAESPGDPLSQLIQEAIADHIVPNDEPKADPYIAAIEAAVSAHLRSILRDTTFQAIEAAWRGLDMLVSRIDMDETLALHVWNVGKSEVLEAMGPGGSAPDASDLHRRLVEDHADAPFTFIVTDFSFGEHDDDQRLLGTLAAMAGRTGGLVLASLSPHAFGAHSWDVLLSAEANEDKFMALRDTPLAAQICAFAPRFLLRQPYGKTSDPLDTFAFEELGSGKPQTDNLLWGAPALLGAILIAQAFAMDGWQMRLNQSLQIGDLPYIVFDDAGERAILPCAEVAFTDTQAERLFASGITPVLAIKNSNAVQLAAFRTLATTQSDMLGPFAL